MSIKNEFDAEGNLTKATHYNSDGSVDFWYGYEYDSDGNMIKQIYYNADGDIGFEYEYITMLPEEINS